MERFITQKYVIMYKPKSALKISILIKTWLIPFSSLTHSIIVVVVLLGMVEVVALWRREEGKMVATVVAGSDKNDQHVPQQTNTQVGTCVGGGGGK